MGRTTRRRTDRVVEECKASSPIAVEVFAERRVGMSDGNDGPFCTSQLHNTNYLEVVLLAVDAGPDAKPIRSGRQRRVLNGL